MANEVGNVSYGVQLGADNSALIKSIQNATQAFERLEKSVGQASARAEQSFKNLDKAMDKNVSSSKKVGNAASRSMDKVAKSITPTIGKLEDLEASYSKIRRQADKVGNTDGFDKINRAMKAYKTQADAGFESTSHMREATTRLSQEMNLVSKETNQYERAIVQMEKSVGAAEREVAMLTARMVSFGASEEEITPLNRALEEYRKDLEAAGGQSLETAQATNTYKAAVDEVKNSMERKRKSIRGATGDNSEFLKQMQNSTKAVQLALGPLSGIASRITAFTALIRTNTISIAGFTAAITGLVVATNRIVKTGIEYERQLLSLEAAISATGRSAETTVDEIDAMARSVAAATLTNSTAARQSLNMLMSMQNVTVDMMKEVTITAQGMASVMGGNLTSTTRMLGRALEQPSSSLDSLRRVGIQFTEAQKDMIRSFEATGQVAKAQGVILDQTRAFYESAQKEAEGLAGQIDAMKDNFQTLFEEISKQIDTNDRLSEVYQTVNDSILALIDNQERIGNIISGVSSIVSVAGKVLTVFANNIEFVAAALTGMFVGAATKGVMALYSFTLGLKKGSTAAATAAIAFKGVSLAMLPMGAAIATTVLGYVALTRGMSRNEDSTKKVQKAHEALAAPFADTELSLDNIRLSLTNVNQEMINNAKLIERQLKSSLETALRGASIEWNNYADSIEDAMSRAMKSVSPDDSDVMGGVGVNPRIIAAIEETTAAFEGFGSDVEDVYNKINDGTAVSAEVIQTLRERAIELEIPADFINMLDKLNSRLLQTKEASKSVSDMTRILREGTISLPMLLENVTKSFGDLIYSIDDLNERTLIKAQQEFINTGDNAERMFDQIFAPMRENAYAKFGDDLFGLTVELSKIDAEQQAAADSARNLFAAWQEAKLEGVRSAFQGIGREMQLMAASTDEARAALEHMHSVQDRADSLMSNFKAATVVADLEASLVAANEEMIRHGQSAIFTESMIQALTSGEYDLAEALEIIRAKMVEVSAITTEFESSTRSSTRATSSQEKSLDSLISTMSSYQSVVERNVAAQKALEEGGHSAIASALEQFDSNKSLEDSLSALSKEMDGYTKKQLRALVKQLGITVKSGESLEDALKRVAKESHNAAKATEALEKAADKSAQAMDDYEDSLENILGGFEENEQAARALADAYMDLSQIQALDNIVEDFNNLSIEEQVQELERMRDLFPELEWGVNSFGDSMREVLINQRTSREYIDFWQNAQNDVEALFEDSFKDIFKNGVDGFSDMADAFKNLFTDLLADLAYQALIKPIVLNIQGAMGMGAQGGIGGGGFDLIGAGNQISSLFGGGAASAGTAGAALGGAQGGLSSAAITSANQVAGGASGGAMAGMAASAGTAVAAYAALEAANWLDQKFASDAKYRIDAGGLGVGFNMISKGLFGGSWQGTGKGGLELGVGRGGVTGRSFTEERKSGGLFRGSSYRDVFSSLDSSFKAQLSQTYNAQLSAVESAFMALGEETAGTVLDSFTTRMRRIRTDGKSEEQISKAINKWLSRTLDSAVSRVSGSSAAKKFAMHGESLSQTIIRLGSALEAFNESLVRVRGDVLNASYASGAAADNIIRMSGGIESLSTLTDYYFNNVLTTEERIRRAIDSGFEALGRFTGATGKVISTTEELKNLVEGLDLTTRAGQRLYAEALKVAPALQDVEKGLEAVSAKFKQDVEQALEAVAAKFTEAMDEISAAVSSAEDDVERLYQAFKDQSFNQQIDLLELMGDSEEALRMQRERELNTIEESLRPIQERIWALQDERDAQEGAQQASRAYANELRNIQSNLQNTLTGISGWIDSRLSTQQSPVANLGAAEKQFQRQLELAQGGDRNALQSITQYADRLLDAGQGMFASGTGFQDIEKEVIAQLEKLPEALTAEEFLAQEFRDALQSSISNLGDTLPEQIGNSLAPMFDNIDLNEDKLIDWDEFRSAFKGLASDQRLKEVFNAIDTNGDGTISRLESLNASSDGTEDNTKSLEERAYDQLDSLKDMVREMSSTTDQFVTLNTTMMSLRDSINALGVAQEEQARIERARAVAELEERGLMEKARIQDTTTRVEGQISGLESSQSRYGNNAIERVMFDKALRVGQGWQDRMMSSSYDYFYSNDVSGRVWKSQWKRIFDEADAYRAREGQIANLSRQLQEVSDVSVLDSLRQQYESLAGEAAPFAKGGVFTNSVVSSPTTFDMGLMGEAGPEAIMPLTNVGGSLGVSVADHNSNIVGEIISASVRSGHSLAQELRELRKEVSKLREDNNERLDASIAVDRAGYGEVLSSQREGNQYMSDLSSQSMLDRSRD